MVRSTRAIASGLPDKSIAVLPFENFSDDKANGYFADGIQDDILTALAKIRDLRVISRTSVENYRGAKSTHNLREIAETLDVANVLEGSVRKVGDRVVMNVQLIDAMQGSTSLGQSIRSHLQESFGIDGQIAREIATALKAKLTSDETARVQGKPTENTRAYDLFLQAKEYEFKPDTFLAGLSDGRATLRPGYHARSEVRARACATGGDPRAYLPLFRTDRSLEARARVSKLTWRLQLQPNLGEAHHALGLCYYWFDRDYAKALREFEIARKLLAER